MLMEKKETEKGRSTSKIVEVGPLRELKGDLRGLIEIVEEFRKVDPEMQAQTMLTLLLVASKEGLSFKQLTDLLGIAQSSTSRNVAALGEIKAKGVPGYGLLTTKENPMDRRTKDIYLSAKGRRVVQTLCNSIARRRREKGEIHNGSS